MQSTRKQGKKERFVEAVCGQVGQIAGELYEWLEEEERILSSLETQILRIRQEIGRQMLMAACAAQVPDYPEPNLRCECGGQAAYVRKRTGQVKTQMGTIQVQRPYYLCRVCNRGQIPLDEQMGFCAGSISAGLDSVLAYVGTLLPFGEGAELLARLLGVSVSANRLRQSTEQLGALVVEEEEAMVEAAWDLTTPIRPSADQPLPETLYISMDGMTVLTREEGWKEQRLGAVYTAHVASPRSPAEEPQVRAEAITYYTAMATPQAFGQGLWVEAQRRGISLAKQTVVIGDGAQWIWRLADEHYPQAIQILDWYHASTYVWKAAHTIYGQESEIGTRWAKHQLDALWAGQLPAVLRRLERHAHHQAVRQVITYFRNHRHRMHYPHYRQMGLQIGSGTIESGCKHVLAHRLRQAGMRWHQAHLQTIAKLRTRLKSDRWDETLDLRPPPSRSYRRLAA